MSLVCTKAMLCKPRYEQLVVNEKSTATEKSRSFLPNLEKFRKLFFLKIIARFGKCLTVFKTFFNNFFSCQNLYGHSVQVLGPPKTCTDTVRSVRSGGDAHAVEAKPLILD